MKTIVFLLIAFLLTAYFVVFYYKIYTKEEALHMREKEIYKKIGSIENYYRLLKYENFKASSIGGARVNYKDKLVGYLFLRDYLKTYNAKFKEYNISENKIIDRLYNRIELEYFKNE